MEPLNLQVPQHLPLLSEVKMYRLKCWQLRNTSDFWNFIAVAGVAELGLNYNKQKMIHSLLNYSLLL